MSRKILFVALTALLVTLPLCVRAQDSTLPVVVHVQTADDAISRESIRDAIHNELRVPTVFAEDPQATTNVSRLTVEIDARHQLVVTYRDALGHQVARTVAAPDDPMAVVATVAFLAGNLARDEAGQIVAAAAPAAPPQVVLLPVVAHGPAPIPAPVVVETLAPTETSTSSVTDRWGISSLLGAGLLIESGVGFVGAIDVAWRTQHWALSLHFLHAEASYRDYNGDPDLYADVTQARNVLTANASYRKTFGIFGVELSAGMGVLIYDYSGASRSYGDAVFAMRVAGLVSIALFENLDIVAEQDTTVALSSLSTSSTFAGTSSLLFTFELGPRVHF